MKLSKKEIRLLRVSLAAALNDPPEFLGPRDMSLGLKLLDRLEKK